jgi:hypothetical protein
MWSHSSEIKKILDKWSKRYLLGDVGVTDRTFANWGLAPGNRPVCIDYAYIFPSSMDQFECICGNKAMTFASADYSSYKCTVCGKVYEDRELRSRISGDERMRLFNNAKGLRMTQEYETLPIEPRYVKYDDNPDLPDIYTVASNVTDHLHGKLTPGWL